MKKGERSIGARLFHRRELSRLEPCDVINEVIYDLSAEQDGWTAETQRRVDLLLHAISTDLDTPATARGGLSLLFVVLSRGGERAVTMARPLFLEKIQAMCHDPRHKNERFLHRVLLLLEDYSPGRVDIVTREAIHLWGEEHFHSAGGFLGRREVHQRGLTMSVKGILGREIEDAGNRSDWEALKRVLDLYHGVK